MTESVIAKDAAEEEVSRIVDFWKLDREGDDWEASKKRLIFAIQKGRVIIDEEKRCITLRLVSPIEKKKGETIEEMHFHKLRSNEPKVGYKKNELMSQTIHLASRMARVRIGVMERMASRDVRTMQAIVAFLL